jgi:hypothetical protein
MGFLFMFDEVKEFLLLSKIFSWVFVNVIIKDFWYGNPPYKIFARFLAVGFLGIRIQ